MKNNKDRNRSSVKAAIIILAGLIIVFGVLLTYIRSRNMRENGSETTVSDESVNSEYEELYERIVNMTEDTYPKQPDEVMSVYTDFYMLLYSNYLDDDRLREFIIKGRIFFGAQLIALNSEDSELMIFENEINDMNSAGVRITSVEAEPCMASTEDEGVYVCYVTRKMSDGLSSYWKYYLAESTSGLYKIRGWERAEQK